MKESRFQPIQSRAVHSSQFILGSFAWIGKVRAGMSSDRNASGKPESFHLE
jgi:hypothetical protein